MYFDHLLLLNTRIVAYGPTKETFTPENLQATYGGKLTLLEQASVALAERSSTTPTVGPAPSDWGIWLTGSRTTKGGTHSCQKP